MDARAERAERAAWGQMMPSGTAQQAEAISRVEAMECARLEMEARVAAEEEAWREEEQRLEELARIRREERAARARAEDYAFDDDGGAAIAAGASDDDGEEDVDLDDGIADGMGSLSTSTPAEVLALEGNLSCFDCGRDAEQLRPGGDAQLVCSLAYAAFVCDACAQIHRGFKGEASTELRAVESLDPDELATLVAAGGNARFAAFLADDEIGVSRRVWVATPLETRYHTPAADLWRRRVRALLADESALPTVLRKVPPPPRPDGLELIT